MLENSLKYLLYYSIENSNGWYCSSAQPFKRGKKIREDKGRGRPNKKFSSLYSVPNMIDSSRLTSQLTQLSLQQKVTTISEGVTGLSADERIAVLKCVSEESFVAKKVLLLI